MFTLFFLILFLFMIKSSNIGSITNTISSKSNNNSQISFKCEKNEKINLKYSSNIKQGTLKLQLTDSKGSVIANLKPNINSSKEILISNTDTYIFCVTYSDFVGNYKIVIKSI